MSQPFVDSDVTALSGPGRARRSGCAEAHGYGEAGQTGLRGKAPLRLRLSLLLLVIPVLLLAWQENDSIQVGEQPDTLAVLAPDTTFVGPLFHNPPVAILNDRPFRVNFFVDFDPEDIESVSLFIRGDFSQTYREIPLEGEYSRYHYILPVEELRGGALTYYFLVTLKDYGLWAYPTGKDGGLEPFVINLVPPTKEFFQKRYYD